MSKTYRTGLVIEGDSSSAVRAMRATDKELERLGKGFERGSRQSHQFSEDIEANGRGLENFKRIASGVGALIAGTFAAGNVASQAQAIANTDALAQSLGASTSTLQAWQYAGQQVGLEADKMGDIFKDVQDKLGDFAANGGGEAADLIGKMGLNIRELLRLSPDQQLLKIAGALQHLDPSQRTHFLEALADEAVRLQPLLENGAGLLRQYTEEARALGIAMDEVDIHNASEAARALNVLKGAAQGLSNQVAADLGPGLAQATSNVTAFIQEVGGADVVMQAALTTAGGLAALYAGRLAGSLATSTAAMISKVAAMRAEAAAELQATQQATRRAAAELQAAKVLQARTLSEAKAAAGTNAHTFALDNLARADARLTQAQAASTAATNAQTAALARASLVARGAAGAIGLVGGPVGVAVLAASALWMFRDSSDDVTASLTDMEQPLDAITDKFRQMTRDQQQAALVKWGSQQADEADKASKALEQLRLKILDATYYSLSRDERPGFVNALFEGFEEVESGAKSFDEVMQWVLSRVDVPEDTVNSWRTLAGTYSDHDQNAKRAASTVSQLKGTMDQAAQAAANLGNSINNGAPSVATIEAWGKLNDQLAEQLAVLRDPSAMGATLRQLDGMDDLPDWMRGYTVFQQSQIDVEKIRQEQAKKARDAARQSTRNQASEAKQLEQRYQSLANNMSQQIALFGETSEVARLRYELEHGNLSGLSRERAEYLLSLQSEYERLEQLDTVQKSLIDRLFPLEAAHRQFREEMAQLDIKAAADDTFNLADAQRRLSNEFSRDLTGGFMEQVRTGGLLDADQLDDANDAAKELGLTFSSAFEDAVIGGENFRDVLSGIAQDLARLTLRKAVTEPAVDALSGAVGSFDWGSLFGFGGGGASASSATGGFFSQMFSEGGYTGPGNRLDPAGIVHAGEFVVKKSIVEKPGVLPMLERLNNMPGYASGGLVGGQASLMGGGPLVQIIDQRQRGAPAEVQESRDPNGMRRFRVLIRDEVKAMHNDGSMDSIMARNHGAKRRPIG